MAAYTTINDPSAYFKVQLYTGDGGTNAITFNDTDTEMQPDLVWIKNRDATDRPCLFDSVRGVTYDWHIDAYDIPNAANTDTLTAFGSNGFTVGADVTVNTNTEKYVAWCWKAGTTSGIDATGADITPSSYSFNQTSGFSIVQYTGAGSVGDLLAHGLANVPHWFMIKAVALNGTARVYHKGFATDAADFYMDTAEADGAVDNAVVWNDTQPTSVLLTLGSDNEVNKSSGDKVYFGYVFTSIQGFSKFGSYEGNGNADGVFVYTGFRPAFVMAKSIDSTSSWDMFDNKREGYNVDNDALDLTETTAESTDDQIDLLSNGFKCRIATDPNVAETFIYMAFAEAPFVNSNGVPCNAR